MHPGKGSNIQIHAVGLPTVVEIEKTLEVCIKNPGRIVVLLWTNPDTKKEYELAANIPVVRTRVGATPMPISSIPELSLTYKISPNPAPTLVWNQTTNDAKVINHLLKREHGGTSNAFAAFDGEDDGKISGNRAGIRDDNGEGSRISGSRPAVMNTGNGGVPPQDASQTNPAMTIKLEGNLGEIDLSNLLQSIAMCKMTGCMRVTNDDVAASLFMDKGTPTHAYVVGSKAITSSSAEIEGSDALLEMLLISDGVFQFNPQQATIERTVPKPLQMYLLEGAALRDHHAQLVDRGITDDAVFARVHKNLEYAAFKAILMDGIPASMPIQKHFYQLSDGKLTLGEMLRKQPLKKSDWVPALYNLLHCGLLEVKDSQNNDDALNFSVEAIASALELGRTKMVDGQTGLIPYPLLLVSIDEEFARYQSKAIPFALATFDVWIQTGAGAQLLNYDDIREMVGNIQGVVNKYDRLGSFADGSFALLMPMQDTSAAALTAQRIMDAARKSAFARENHDGGVKVMVGLSGVPDIAADISTLLKTAHEAKNVCKKTGANIYTHRNLSKSRS